MAFEETVNVSGRSIADDLNIFISGFPGIAQQLAPCFFVNWNQSIAQPIESIPQRAAPFLVPLATAAAAAIIFPATDPVRATPGRHRFEFHFPSGRILTYIMSKIRHRPASTGKLFCEGVGEAFFGTFFVVAESFAVRRHAD